MAYLTGKAISGGTPLTPQQLESMARDHLTILRESFSRQTSERKTDDMMALRLAEELRLVERMLELARQDAQKRGAVHTAKTIEQSEDAIEDVAKMVEAGDRCDTLDDIDEDMARRLNRRAMDGRAAPCDNRGPAGDKPLA